MICWTLILNDLTLQIHTVVSVSFLFALISYVLLSSQLILIFDFNVFILLAHMSHGILT